MWTAGFSLQSPHEGLGNSKSEKFLDKVVLAHDGDKVTGKRVILFLFPYIAISLDVPIYCRRERRVKVSR